MSPDQLKEHDPMFGPDVAAMAEDLMPNVKTEMKLRGYAWPGDDIVFRNLVVYLYETLIRPSLFRGVKVVYPMTAERLTNRSSTTN